MRATRVGVHFLTLSVLLSAAPVPDQTGSHVVGGARGPAPGKVGAAHSSLAGDAVGIDAVMQEIIDSKRFAPNRGRLPGGALEVVGSGAEHEDKHVDALRKFLGNREAKRPVLLSTPRVNHQMHAAGLASSFSRSNASTEYRTGAAIGETDWDGSKQIVVAAAGRGNISHVKEEGASTETDVCFAPPCPPPFASGFSIKPSRGVNNNLQESTAIVTISGLFFPTDCSKACKWGPKCYCNLAPTCSCDMEVTYRIYFGTEAVGCNFNDLAASACKCLPLSGDELLGGCGWHADPTDPSSAVWACTTITCQVAPLFGTQPLKMFFQDKACRDNCSVFPMGADDRVDVEVAMFPGVNFTYDPPVILETSPGVLPAEGGTVTIIGANFGGDSNFIWVTVDGVKQGVATNPKLASPDRLSVVVVLAPHEEGPARLEVYVGLTLARREARGEGALSPPFSVVFAKEDPAHRLILIVTGVCAVLVATMVAMLTVHRYAGRGPRGRNDRGRRHRLREGLLSSSFDDTHFTIASSQVTLDYKLARGAFGNVFKGTWLGTEVAVKQIDVWSLQDLEAFLDEASILAQLHHPNIVQLLGVCDSRNPQGGREMLLVMEFLQQGSLNEVLLDPAVELADARKLQMALDAARGMLYLHTLTPPVLHRDLKSPNLLVDQRFKVKIADFGLSRFRVEYTMTFCGSPKWTAPEVLNGESYGTAADSWSFGVVLWEMATRKVPYAAGTWQTSGAAAGPRSLKLKLEGAQPDAGGHATSSLDGTKLRAGRPGRAALPAGGARESPSASQERAGGDGGASARAQVELHGSQVAVKVAREGSLLVMPAEPAALVETARACLAFDAPARPTFSQIVAMLQLKRPQLAQPAGEAAPPASPASPS